MREFISWNKLWNIIYPVEFEFANPEIALIKVVKLLKSASGTFEVNENKLIFIEYYDFTNYKWSTSVIGSSDKRYKVEKGKTMLDKVEEERNIIKYLLDSVNEKFSCYDDLYLKIFYERNFLDQSIDNIRAKYSINNKRYYLIIEASEYLFKRAWLLTTPPKELKELIESD